VFAEVALPQETAAGAGSFGVHPALLDAALHAAGLAGEAVGAGSAAGPGEILLPFAWTGVSVHAPGASMLRVRLAQAASGAGMSLTAADGSGALVVSADSLVSRPVPAGQLAAAGGGPLESLFTVEWNPVSPVPVTGEVAADRCAVVGDDQLGLAGAGLRVYPDLAALAAAGEPVPEVVPACAGSAGIAAGQGDMAGAARAGTGAVLGLVQAWLADEQLSSARLVLVTQGAVAVDAGEGVADLAGAAVWDLVRSAQSEHPGRLVLVDLPAGDAFGSLATTLASGEPELAIRAGTVYARRLGRPAGALVPPRDGGPWRLEPSGAGTLDGLALAPCPEAAAPLEAGQVRVAVRAAGLNFRDVLIGLGMYPGGGRPGARDRRGRVRLRGGDRGAGAGADPGGMVVRPGRVGAGGVHDRVVRAGGPGRGAGGPAAAGARGGGRGEDGGGGDRPAPGRGGVRHRLARQAPGAGRAGPGRRACGVVA
jgi:hypothetical protein